MSMTTRVHLAVVESLVVVCVAKVMIGIVACCYSLRSELLVQEINVSRCILVIDTSIFIHFDDKYFRTEGILSSRNCINGFC